MSDEVDGRVKRAQESREQRRAAILETALQVFADKGFHRTSISDVVKAAGVARGTFYLYFDSKNAIFQELIDTLMSQLRSSVVGVDASSGAPGLEQQLTRIVSGVLLTVQNNRPLTRILFREAIGLDADVDARMQDFFDELRVFVAQSIRTGQALGWLRDETQVDLAALCAVGALREVVVKYVIEEDRDFDDVDATAAAVVRFALFGLEKR